MGSRIRRDVAATQIEKLFKLAIRELMIAYS